MPPVPGIPARNHTPISSQSGAIVALRSGVGPWQFASILPRRSSLRTVRLPSSLPARLLSRLTRTMSGAVRAGQTWSRRGAAATAQILTGCAASCNRSAQSWADSLVCIIAPASAETSFGSGAMRLQSLAPPRVLAPKKSEGADRHIAMVHSGDPRSRFESPLQAWRLIPPGSYLTPHFAS